MANPQKGEVVLEIEDQRFTLALGFNDVCELEAETGMTFPQLATKASSGSFTAIRHLFWGMTRRHHREMSVTDIGDFVGRVGFDVLMQKFEAVAKSMTPDKKDAKALKLRPRKAQA